MIAKVAWIEAITQRPDVFSAERDVALLNYKRAEADLERDIRIAYAELRAGIEMQSRLRAAVPDRRRNAFDRLIAAHALRSRPGMAAALACPIG